MRPNEKCVLKVKERRTFWQSYGGIVKRFIVILFSLVTFVPVLYFYNNPCKIIDINFDLCFIIYALGIILIGISQILVLKKMRGKKVLFIILSAVITVSVLTFFGYSVVTFEDRLGVVTVNTAADFKYIKNYKYGTFKLNCDIEAEEISDIKIGSFYGVLDGQGREINNYQTDNKPFIANNKGEIVNIVFNNPKLTSPIISENSNIIQNIIINNADVKFGVNDIFGGVAGINNKKGKIDGCAVNGILINSDIKDIDLSSNTEIPACDTFGGICGENEGQITNCNVIGINSSALSSRYFGGVSGKNGSKKLKSVIYNCSASNININIKCSNSFGGISGSGYTNIVACDSSGNVNIYGTSVLNYGGIIGALKDSSITLHSSSEVDMNVIILSTDYKTNIAVGGAVGVMENNTKIATTKNSSNVTVTINELGNEAKLYLGGMTALFNGTNCVIENSVNFGDVKLNQSDFKKGLWNSIYIGGFACAYNYENDIDGLVLTIDKCFTFGKVESEYYEVAVLGGLQAYNAGVENATITNSVFAGEITKPSGMYWVNCQIAGSGENNYYIKNCGYAPSYSQEGKVVDEISKSKLKKSDFAKNTLGLDDSIWNIETGNYPALKQMDVIGSEILNDKIVKPIKDPADEMSKDEKTFLVLGLIFIIGLAIIIGFSILVGGGSSYGYSNDGFEADDWEALDPGGDWTDAD